MEVVGELSGDLDVLVVPVSPDSLVALHLVFLAERVRVKGGGRPVGVAHDWEPLLPLPICINLSSASAPQRSPADPGRESLTGRRERRCECDLSSRLPGRDRGHDAGRTDPGVTPRAWCGVVGAVDPSWLQDVHDVLILPRGDDAIVEQQLSEGKHLLRRGSKICPGLLCCCCLEGTGQRAVTGKPIAGRVMSRAPRWPSSRRPSAALVSAPALAALRCAGVSVSVGVLRPRHVVLRGRCGRPGRTAAALEQKHERSHQGQRRRPRPAATRRRRARTGAGRGRCRARRREDGGPRLPPWGPDGLGRRGRSVDGGGCADRKDRSRLGRAEPERLEHLARRCEAVPWVRGQGAAGDVTERRRQPARSPPRRARGVAP